MNIIDKLRHKKEFILIISVALISIVYQLAFYDVLEFHRDELLYLSLGEHLDFGYHSVPPFIGLLAFISVHLFGYTLFAAKFFPAIAGGILIWVSSLIAKELKGGLFAQFLTAISIMGSILFARAFGLLQPVPFDILFWTLSFYLIIRYINTTLNKYLLFLGISIGIGFLNKYNILFLVISLLIVAPITKFRKIFLSKYFYFSILIAFVIVLPNLIWQIVHHFPVVRHMSELRDSQLVKMSPSTFIMEQFLMILPATFVAVPGISYLLFARQMKEFRLPGFITVAVLLVLLLLQGKGYYTAGIYPFLIASGAVFFEKILVKSWSRVILVSVLIYFEWLVLPIGKPIYGPDQLVRYFDKMEAVTGNNEARRYEDNAHHKLPQDYADMLGWNELTELTSQAWQKVENKNSCIIYGENYGEAGAITIIGKKYHLPNAVSFSDNFRYWIPKSFKTEITDLIYINDEPGDDIKALFADIQKIGQINNPLAREYGIGVFLCKKPRSSFNQFWESRLKSLEMN
ncbi:MAG: glycosyltransferase family 39 protein [Bacteroidia bacterium]